MRKRIFAFVLSIVMLLSATPMNMLYAIGEDYLDNDSLYSALLAAQTVEEFSALLNSNLTDEESAQAFLDSVGEEELTNLVIKSEELKANYVKSEETVNFTDAAPLMDAPVKKKAPLKALAKSPAKAAPQTKDVDGLETFKSIVDNKDGTYTITLEVYTTGEVKTETQIMPADIVLVLDQSGSMTDQFKAVQTEGYRQVYTYNNALLNLFDDGNYYVKLSNDQFSKLTINYSLGKYRYQWKDENGETQRADSYFSANNCPDVLQGNLYRFYSSSSTISRKEALTDAANAFLTYVQEQAETYDVDHRVAIVGFADDEGWRGNYNNTELLSTSSEVNYGSATNQDYINALVSANDSGAINSRLTEAVGRLDADGGTYINYGLDMAQKIFNNASATDSNGNTRNRVIIVLTDGTPGSGRWEGNVENQSCARDALAKASALKESGVTIYSIGIFEGANPTTSGSNSGSNDQKNNYFLQKLSSNNGIPRNPSYYLAASDGESLTLIFQSVSNQIGIPKIDLSSETVVKDFMTPYFEIPEGTEVKLYTAACNGGDEENGFTFADRIAYTPGEGDVTLTDDDGVLVTGFDFSANFCAKISDTEYRGKKLIIEFDAAAKDGVIIRDTELVYDEETGTYMVPTNLDKSGVYTDEQEEEAVEPFLPFEIPETVTYAVNTKHVIFNADGTIKSTTDIIDTLHVLPGKNVTISVEGDEYETFKFVGWYSDAVCETLLGTEKEYSKQASNDGVIYYAKFVLDEAPYKVRHYLQNANGDGYTLKTTNEYDLSGAPYVGIIGQLTTKADAHPRTETGYEHYTAVTPIVQQTIAADGSTYVDIYYNLDTYTIKYVVDGETEETSTYKFGQNVADYQAVVKTNYDFHGWYTDSDYKTEWTKPATMTAGDITVYGYHTRKLGTLTVSKSGMSEGETAIFTVTGGNLGSNGIKIAVSNGGSVTIKDLYVGETYTVTEDSGWTWRYGELNPIEVTLSEDSVSGTASFVNVKTNRRWLDAFSIIKNVFNGAVK